MLTNLSQFGVRIQVNSSPKLGFQNVLIKTEIGVIFCCNMPKYAVPKGVQKGVLWRPKTVPNWTQHLGSAEPNPRPKPSPNWPQPGSRVGLHPALYEALAGGQKRGPTCHFSLVKRGPNGGGYYANSHRTFSPNSI